MRFSKVALSISLGICALCLVLFVIQIKLGRPLGHSIAIPIDSIKQEKPHPLGNHAFSFRLPVELASEKDGPRRAKIYENGRLLPYYAKSRPEVNYLGQGAFFVKKRIVLFSATDNTDPRTNGRRYEVWLPTDIPAMAWVFVGLTLLFLGVLAFYSSKEQLHSSLVPTRLLVLNLWVFLVLLVLAYVFSVLALKRAEVNGSLASVPAYDDITYIYRSNAIWLLLSAGEIADAMRLMLLNYLHSPFSVWAGVLGFAIFGHSVYGLYHINLVVVFTYLCVVIFLLRGVSLKLSVPLSLLSLALPFATMAAVEFRPDMMCAIIISGLAVIWIRIKNPFQSWRCAVAYGALSGVALLTKPSTTAVIILVLGGTWLLVALRARFVCKSSLLTLFSHCAITVGTALAIAGWYFALHYQTIFSYFFQHSFGSTKSVWAAQISVFEHASYYLRGEAVQSNVGYLFIPLLTLYLIGAVTELRTRSFDSRWRGFSMLWMLCGLYLLYSLFEMKGSFLAMPFYTFLIFGSFAYMSRFCYKIERAVWQRACLIGSWLLMVAGWSAYSFPKAAEQMRLEALVNSHINAGVINALHPLLHGKYNKVLFTHSLPVIPEYVAMQCANMGKPFAIESSALDNNMEEVLAKLGDANAVVLQDKDLLGSPSFPVPGEEMQQALLKRLTNTLDTWSGPVKVMGLDGKYVYIFSRK